MPEIRDSILMSIENMLGINSDNGYYDEELIMHINSIFTVLRQIGLGPEAGFVITGETEEWTSFMPTGQKLELVKSYMYARVKMIFDPPTNSSAAANLQKIIDEFEWRISVAVDPEEDNLA